MRAHTLHSGHTTGQAMVKAAVYHIRPMVRYEHAGGVPSSVGVGECASDQAVGERSSMRVKACSKKKKK